MFAVNNSVLLIKMGEGVSKYNYQNNKMDLGQYDKLTHLIKNNNLKKLKEFFKEEKLSINAIGGHHKNTVLHEIMYLKGSIKMLKWVLDFGGDPNIKNKHGSTTLHDAAYYGRTKMLKYLLEAGADTSIKSNVGFVPKQSLVQKQKIIDMLEVAEKEREQEFQQAYKNLVDPWIEDSDVFG